MIPPQQQMEHIINLCRKLADKTGEYQELQEASAEAARNYDIALAAKMLTLKVEGMPTTILEKIAKGDKVIADLKFKVAVAEAIARSCKEAMDNIKIAVQSYQSILSWERETYTKTQ